MTSYVQRAAAELVEMLKSKNHDYAPTTEFSNFEKAAEFAGVQPMDAIAVQIGIKYTRLQGLADNKKHESLRDSFMDLAGYALIAAGYLDALSEVCYSE